MQVTKAVIPAGGLGTRFLPITKAVPKEMLPIVDKPTLYYVVEEAVLSGAKEILIIVSEGKDAIRNFFSPSDLYERVNSASLEELNDLISSVSIHYVKQEALNGNGGAILLAKEFAAGDPFSVLFGDDIFYSPDLPATKQLVNAFIKVGGKTIVGCQTRSPADAAKYASIDHDEINDGIAKINDIVEKPAIETLPSPCLCSVGRFVLPYSIFDALDRTAPVGGEIILANAIRLILKTEEAYACDFSGEMYDIGDKFGFLKANVEYALRSPFKDQSEAYLKEIAKRL